MTKSSKAQIAQEAKTIAWFEQAMLANMPQHGILDTISLGIWGIAEQSGQLAGEWKRHRNFMQDLDTEKVTAALGELLGAIVQTAHSLGVPLESVMDQQIERVRAQPLAGARKRKSPHAQTPASAASAEAPPRGKIRQIKAEPRVEVQPLVVTHHRSERPKKTTSGDNHGSKRAPERQVSSRSPLPDPRKRGQSAQKNTQLSE